MARLLQRDFKRRDLLFPTRDPGLPVRMQPRVADIGIARILLPGHRVFRARCPGFQCAPVRPAFVKRLFGHTNDDMGERPEEARLVKIIQNKQDFRRSVDNQPARTVAHVFQTGLKQVSRPHRLYGACLQRPHPREECRGSGHHPQAVHVGETGSVERCFAVLIGNGRLDEDSGASLLQPCPRCLRPVGVGLDQHQFVRNLLVAQIRALATPDTDEQAETFAVETKTALHQSRTFLGA